MQLPIVQPRVLWHVETWGRHTNPAGKVYHWDNRDRQPAGTVVAQLTLAGRIRFVDNSGSREVSSGDLMLFAYGEPTSYGLPDPLAEPYTCCWVNLRGAGLEEHLRLFRERFGTLLHVGVEHPLARGVESLITLAQPDAGATPIEHARHVSAFVCDLFDFAQQRQLASLSPVDQAIQRIVNDPYQRWSLKALADDCGCSREHLARVFHNRVGEPPAKFIQQHRTRRAVAMLRESSLPLNAIANQAGFASVHTLIRQVRQATGRNPSELRRG